MGLRGDRPRQRARGDRDRRQGQRLAARDRVLPDPPGRGPAHHDRPGPGPATRLAQPVGRQGRDDRRRGSPEQAGDDHPELCQQPDSPAAHHACCCAGAAARRADPEDVPLGWPVRDCLCHRGVDQPVPHLHAQRVLAVTAQRVRPAVVAEQRRPDELSHPGDAGQPAARPVTVVHLRVPVERRPDRTHAGDEGLRCDLPRLHLVARRPRPLQSRVRQGHRGAAQAQTSVRDPELRGPVGGDRPDGNRHRRAGEPLRGHPRRPVHRDAAGGRRRRGRGDRPVHPQDARRRTEAAAVRLPGHRLWRGCQAHHGDSQGACHHHRRRGTLARLGEPGHSIWDPIWPLPTGAGDPVLRRHLRRGLSAVRLRGPRQSLSGTARRHPARLHAVRRPASCVGRRIVCPQRTLRIPGRLGVHPVQRPERPPGLVGHPPLHVVQVRHRRQPLPARRGHPPRVAGVGRAPRCHLHRPDHGHQAQGRPRLQ